MTALEWLLDQWPILESKIPIRILEEALEMEKQQIIDFGVWYSGMEQEKVKKAFERFKNEQK